MLHSSRGARRRRKREAGTSIEGFQFTALFAGKEAISVGLSKPGSGRPIGKKVSFPGGSGRT